MELSADVSIDCGEGGITVYMCENEHYDVAVRKSENGYEAVFKLNIGNIRHEQAAIKLPEGKAALIIRSNSQIYNFYVKTAAEEIHLGYGMSKYLSSEVSGGFTGVVLGLYAQSDNAAKFENFSVEYFSEE